MFVCAYETTSITWNETVIVFAFPKCLFRSDCPVASGECPVFPACSGGSKPHNPCELVNYPNDLHFDNPFALPSVRSSNSAPGKAFNVILLAFDDMVMNACGCRIKPFLIACYHHQSLKYIYAARAVWRRPFCLSIPSGWHPTPACESKWFCLMSYRTPSALTRSHHRPMKMRDCPIGPCPARQDITFLH